MDFTSNRYVFIEGNGFVQTGVDIGIRGLTRRNTQFRALGEKKPKGLTRGWFSNGADGAVALGLDEDSILISYREGIICWRLDGTMLATLSPSTHSSQRRYIASVAGTRVFVANNYGELNLIDLHANKILDERKLDSVGFNDPSWKGPVETAGHGRFVILGADPKRGPDSVCVFLIEGDSIRGPWYVRDPDTNTVLESEHFRASRESHWLAVESDSHEKESGPRIILVDLNKLVSTRES